MKSKDVIISINDNYVFIILGGFMRYLLCVGIIKKGKFKIKINEEVKNIYGN